MLDSQTGTAAPWCDRGSWKSVSQFSLSRISSFCVFLNFWYLLSLPSKDRRRPLVQINLSLSAKWCGHRNLHSSSSSCIPLCLHPAVMVLPLGMPGAEHFNNCTGTASAPVINFCSSCAQEPYSTAWTSDCSKAPSNPTPEQREALAPGWECQIWSFPTSATLWWSAGFMMILFAADQPANWC